MLNNFSYGPIWSFAGRATFALRGGGVAMFFTEIAMVQRESFKAKQNWAERCG